MHALLKSAYQPDSNIDETNYTSYASVHEKGQKVGRNAPQVAGGSGSFISAGMRVRGSSQDAGLHLQWGLNEDNTWRILRMQAYFLESGYILNLVKLLVQYVSTFNNVDFFVTTFGRQESLYVKV